MSLTSIVMWSIIESGSYASTYSAKLTPLGIYPAHRRGSLRCGSVSRREFRFLPQTPSHRCNAVGQIRHIGRKIVAGFFNDHSVTQSSLLQARLLQDAVQSPWCNFVRRLTGHGDAADFDFMLYWRWLPFVATRYQPPASSRRMTSRIVSRGGFRVSAAPARRATRVALLAGAVPHHGEVVALGAFVAGVALEQRLLAPCRGELLRFGRLVGGGVGE